MEKVATFLTSCDRRKMMYIASVTLENFLRSDVVEERYGLKTLDVLLRRRMLR